MPYRTIALILALGTLAGCSTTSRVFERKPTVPVIQKVEVVKYVPIDDKLTRRGTIAHAKDRSVGEYVRVANTNTPLLRQCYFQLEEIEKLQPKEKP